MALLHEMLRLGRVTAVCGAARNTGANDAEWSYAHEQVCCVSATNNLGETRLRVRPSAAVRGLVEARRGISRASDAAGVRGSAVR